VEPAGLNPFWPEIRRRRGMLPRLALAILIVCVQATGLASATVASNICRTAFAGPNFSYSELSPDVYPPEFIKIASEIRARVIQSLGALPDLKRTTLSDVSDIKLYLPGTEKTKANMIAYSSYRNLAGKTLEVEMTWVRDDLRRMGFSKLLFAEILALHPKIKRVHVSDLVDTNLELFENARSKDGLALGKKDSIRETLLFKKYAAFGFTKIENIKITKMKTFDLKFVEGNYAMVLEHPSIQFDLVRSK
jgi:hypothetical protein